AHRPGPRRISTHARRWLRGHAHRRMDEVGAAPRPVHYLVLLAAQLAVGSAAILARTGLTAGLSPISLAAWRLTIASAILSFGMWIARRRRGESPIRLGRSDVLWLLAA